MVLIYQVLTRQCLKKVFLTSNDFVSNDSSLLNVFFRKIGYVLRDLIWNWKKNLFDVLSV